MTKYLVPSAGFSAFLSSYFGFNYFSREKKLESLTDAVHCLNERQRVNEAIDFILRADVDATRAQIPQLNIGSIGALAGHGWPLVEGVPIKRFPVTDDDMHIESLLEKFDLGEDFQAALDWLNRVPCDEEELSCTDSWFGKRPSRTARLQRILQVIYIKTEKPSGKQIDTDIVQFLYNMFMAYRTENRQIFLLTLKTLANVALLSEEHATAILESEWLPILSRMVVSGKTLNERMISHKIFRNALFSLGLTDYFLRSDVYELHLSMSEPVIDVVLIHGLRGSSSYTWRQKSLDNKTTITECWPKDWLPHDLNDPIRIIGLDYPSYLFQQFTGSMESLQMRADRCAEQLEDAGIGRRPVVFICHSMGGLLAKKLLLDVLAIRKQTVGILFIATPHKGSPVATSWSYEILLPSDDVRFLRESNETNKKLDVDFSKIHDSIPIIASMIETVESKLIGNTLGIVVPRESAVYSRGALYHIEEAHHNVCKPSERSSPAYGVVLNFVRDAIVEAKRRSHC